MDTFFVNAFLDGFEAPPDEIVLDLDATDDPLHGAQEGRIFHGCYGCYSYLPLYVFCGDHLLCIRLRLSGIDGPACNVEDLDRIVRQSGVAWQQASVLVCGLSRSALQMLMARCEQNEVKYVFGLARSSLLKAALN